MSIDVTRSLLKAAEHLRRREYAQAISIVEDEVKVANLSKSAKVTANKILAIALKAQGDVSSKVARRGTTKTNGLGDVLFCTRSPPASSTSKPALAYCVLLMEHEKEVTITTISNLLQQIDNEDRVLVLFNGFADQSLKVHMESHAGVICIETSANLGVAGGRNNLYQYVLDDLQHVTHIVTLDNDVLLPNDLNQKIKQKLRELYDSLRVAVMGGVILDYKRDQTREYVEQNFLKFKGYFSADCYNLFSDDIAKYLEENREKLKNILWHIGMHDDYRSVYIDRSDILDPEEGKSFQPFLAHAPGVADLLEKEYFPVSNVPGCFQVFSVDHLRSIGMLEDRFSPYFFEDSEFCIRGMLSGKKNIICTSLYLMHGTDNRHVKRKQGDSKYLHLLNEYRARYVLLRRLSVQAPVPRLLDQARRIYSPGKGDFREKELAAAVQGIQRGIAQFNDVQAHEDFSALNVHRKNSGIQVTPAPIAVKPKLGEPTFDVQLPKKGDSLPRIYFGRLKRFRDIYRDQDCLIICNGPSLKKTNLGLFAGIPTFAVNSTFILQDLLGFVPTFYTVEDNHVIADNIDQIRRFKAGAKFFPENYRDILGDAPDQFFLPASWDCYFKSKVSFEYPEFSKDIARTIYTGQTVTYLNLQLAYYFGFRRVFIVGLDFSYSIPKGARIDNNSIDHEDDDPNHFHPAYFGKGKQWHFPKLDSCLSSYAIAREAFVREGREVIDLTIGGRLGVFPKMTITDALGLPSSLPQLAEPLDFSQYVLDACFAFAKLSSFYFYYLAPSQPFSLERVRGCVECIARSDYRESMTVLVAQFDFIVSQSECIVFYPKCNLVIRAPSFEFVSRLPLCGWVDCALNCYYYDNEGDNVQTVQGAIYGKWHGGGDIRALTIRHQELLQSSSVVFVNSTSIFFKS